MPGGLQPGAVVRIRAQIERVVSDAIVINLQTGPGLDPNDDVNLHLSIRPHENIIVRNHMKNQRWGREERSEGFPIKLGEFVEISIYARSTCFQVAINGKHFCDFGYRLAAHTVRFIHITGEMTFESITIGNDIPPPAPRVSTLPLYQPVSEFNKNWIFREILISNLLRGICRVCRISQEFRVVFRKVQ